MTVNKKGDSLLLPSKHERLQLFGTVDPVKGKKPVVKEEMQDIQNSRSDFLFELEQVGIIISSIAPITNVVYYALRWRATMMIILRNTSPCKHMLSPIIVIITFSDLLRRREC